MLTALLVFPVLLTMFLLAMERLESALLDDVDGDAATPVEGRAATGPAADDAERPGRPARRPQNPPTAGRRPLRRVGPDRPGRRLPGRSTDESAGEWRKSA